MPTEEPLLFFCCVAACVDVVKQIRKQVAKVVIQFLSELEFLRKLSGPFCGTGSDVKDQRTKPASYFMLLVFRKAHRGL